MWFLCQGTGTADQTDVVKLGSGQLNLTSLRSTLVWQLPTVEHKSTGMLVETAMSIGQAR